MFLTTVYYIFTVFPLSDTFEQNQVYYIWTAIWSNKRPRNRKTGEGKGGMADTYDLQPVDIIPNVIAATGLMKTNLQK